MRLGVVWYSHCLDARVASRPDFSTSSGIGRPTKEDLDAIRTRKPEKPRIEVQMADGSTRYLWCTFGPQQIDIDPFSEPGSLAIVCPPVIRTDAGLRLCVATVLCVGLRYMQRVVCKWTTCARHRGGLTAASC